MKIAVAALSLIATASAFTTSAPRAFTGVKSVGFASKAAVVANT